MTDHEMQHYYNLRAPEYEQIYYRDNPDRANELAREAACLLKLANSKQIVELACGTGYWTSVMSDSAAEITASDISYEMLDEARRKNYGCPTRFVKADIYNSIFRLPRADVVVLGFWFSHHPRHQFDLLFDQLESCVRKDGRIWLMDNNPPAEGPENVSVRTDEFGNNYKTRRLDDGREFTIMKNYFSEPELRAIFESRYEIERLYFGEYYWTVALKLPQK